MNQPDRARAAKEQRRARLWAGAALVLAGLLLYLATLDNGLQPYELQGGDLITHQYAQVQARPSNAPGYPLYTMGGWLWFHTGRTVAQAMQTAPPNPLPLLSSYSTLWALLALWLLYAIICRVTESARHPAGNWPVAWLVSAFYAVTYFFWYYATTTEQYSSAIAQTLAIVYVYIVWSDELRISSHELRSMHDESGAHSLSASNSSRVTRHLLLLFLLAFLCGLALAHMLTIAFIVPPLVAVVLWQAPELLRSPRAIVGSIIAAALPLLGYVYVYVRGAAHPEWWGAGDWSSAREWFWAFVSTAQGRDELSWGFAPEATFFANGFPELIWQELSVPFVLFGLVGILLLERRLAVLIYSFSALTLAFAWAYRYGNWYQVILPVYPLLLIGVAALFDRLELRMSAAAPRNRPDLRRALQVGVLLMLAVAVVWRIDASLPAADSRDRAGDTALDRAAVLLDQPLPLDAGLFAAVDDALALQYLTEIWGLGGDAWVVSSRAAGTLLDRGQRVLSTWEATPTLVGELGDRSGLLQVAHSPDWIAFVPATESSELSAPDATQSLGAVEDVVLADYTMTPAPRGEPVTLTPAGLDVTLIWRVPAGGWPDGLSISLRPTRAGAPMADPAAPDSLLQQDRTAPADALSQALPGDTELLLVDPYRFTGAENADGLLLLLYRTTEQGFDNLVELTLPRPLSD